MSTSYQQEPPTSGKVILKTSSGDIEIELWCQEIPRACRNFIQLCMERYYDNTLFHRLIPGFMIQGGDPTGSGEGGDSIYGKPFQDEFHQRLKFSHRGIVAMANSKPNDNGSQFFITFDKCNWLDKRHTIFGKVVGDTIYNLNAMNSIETDADDRPINPPKIISAEVIVNPFDDIVLRNARADQIQKEEALRQEQKQKQQQAQQKKKKGQIKNKSLLSFADEEEEEEEESRKIVSSHDLLQNDARLKKETAVSQEQLNQQREQKQKYEQSKEQLISQVRVLEKQQKRKEHERQFRGSESEEEEEEDDDDIEINKKRKMKERLADRHQKRKLQLQKQMPQLANKELEREKQELLKGFKAKRGENGETQLLYEGESGSGDESSSKSENESSYESTDSEEYLNEEQKKVREKQKQEYDKLKLDFLQFKSQQVGSIDQDRRNREQEEKKLLSFIEQKRLQFIEKKKQKATEEEVMRRLNSFRSKLNSDKVQKDSENWMNNKLVFHIDSARAYQTLDNKKKAETRDKIKKPEEEEDDLVTIDTRKERKQEEVEQIKKKVLTVEELIKLTE